MQLFVPPKHHLGFLKQQQRQPLPVNPRFWKYLCKQGDRQDAGLHVSRTRWSCFRCCWPGGMFWKAPPTPSPKRTTGTECGPRSCTCSPWVSRAAGAGNLLGSYPLLINPQIPQQLSWERTPCPQHLEGGASGLSFTEWPAKATSLRLIRTVPGCPTESCLLPLGISLYKVVCKAPGKCFHFKMVCSLAFRFSPLRTVVLLLSLWKKLQSPLVLIIIIRKHLII